jgi:anti-sigma-K factor RskA
MPMRRHGSDNGLDAERFELAALADGSLSHDRLSQLEARVAASQELSDLLTEQLQGLGLTRSVNADVEAPDGLRRRVDAQRQPRSSRVGRRLVTACAAAAVATAAALAASALTTDGSYSGFRAALMPTRVVPDATGEAMLTRQPSGWRVELDAAGLPRLTDGAFYEAWLRTDAGVLVPIGTFNDARRVTLWAGVPPTRFTTLTVTRERADGEQGSSGEKVLVGTVTHSG